MEKIPAEKSAIRICCEDNVFVAPLHALREELGGLYHGFERWGRNQYLPLTLEQLLKVQKDLRLCVQFSEEDTRFCDLTHKDINADPFDVLKSLDADPERYFEYKPLETRWVRLRPTEDTLLHTQFAYEDALFTK